MKTTGSELLDISLGCILLFGGLVAGTKFDDLASHARGDRPERARRLLALGDLGALLRGVEGLKSTSLMSARALDWSSREPTTQASMAS